MAKPWYIKVLPLYPYLRSYLVEVTGVEPVSEKSAIYLSPSAVYVLTFPQMHAHKQAYIISSFINTPLAQSFAKLRVPL